MLGRIVGTYEFVRRLGAGGVGEVYAGIDRELGRAVAIKALRPEVSRDAGFIGRFRAEAASLARLNHPNIATLFALHREGDELFMIMELVRGRTLEDILLTSGRLTERECLGIIVQAIDGLSYAHRMGVVHRDIKPSNLMITEEGALKIMDFGIARVRGSERLTRQGHIVGTLAYMSPEQIRGQDGDGRSDLYSLGIVLYEMLAGTPPFLSDSEYDLLKSQVEDRPARLVDRFPEVSPALESAVLNALEKNPDNRFPTIEAFGQAVGATAVRADAIEIVRARFADIVSAALTEMPQHDAPAETSLGPSASSQPVLPPAQTVFAGGFESGSPPVVGPAVKARKGVSTPVLTLAIAATLFVGVMGYLLFDTFSGKSTPVASTPAAKTTVADSQTKSVPETSRSMPDSIATKTESEPVTPVVAEEPPVSQPSAPEPITVPKTASAEPTTPYSEPAPVVTVMPPPAIVPLTPVVPNGKETGNSDDTNKDEIKPKNTGKQKANTEKRRVSPPKRPSNSDTASSSETPEPVRRREPADHGSSQGWIFKR